MKRAAILAMLAGLFVPACMTEVGEPDGEELGEVAQEAQGGKWCTSSLDCNGNQYCTTDDGDCLSPPGCKNQPCIAVCYGRCAAAQPASGEACGNGVCPAGEVCCNDSCGICTPPDGFCTQQICESTSL
jgi:hypothetical protein